jgi:hypothetical protein
MITEPPEAPPEKHDDNIRNSYLEYYTGTGRCNRNKKRTHEGCVLVLL